VAYIAKDTQPTLGGTCSGRHQKSISSIRHNSNLRLTLETTDICGWDELAAPGELNRARKEGHSSEIA